MKRGDPLKRTPPLARKTALKRSSAPLSRSQGLGRGNGPAGRPGAQIARNAPARKATIPAKVREAVYAREKGRCVRCRHRVGRGLFERALHHVLAERLWPEHVKVDANVVLVCATCHAEHEFGARDGSRLSLSDLPAVTREWLATVSDGPIENYIARTYRDGA